MKQLIRIGHQRQFFFFAITNLALLIVCVLFLVPSYGFDHKPMLPKTATVEQSFIGWWMSEKLDGVRAYWDGEKLWSKNGQQLHPPYNFIQGLPTYALEGELWAGRNCFEYTSSIVLRQQPHSGWLELQFAIFDLPIQDKTFQHRIDKVRQWFNAQPSQYAFVIKQTKVRSEQHLQQEQKRITKLGGEGLIIRDPNAYYSSGRSQSIFKIKPFYDDEAVVIGHLNGKGQNHGRLGALLVQNSAGLSFKIGTGFNQNERINPPAIGTTITYKYNGFYQSGLPKFPVFLRIRHDEEL